MYSSDFGYLSFTNVLMFALALYPSRKSCKEGLFPTVAYCSKAVRKLGVTPASPGTRDLVVLGQCLLWVFAEAIIAVLFRRSGGVPCMNVVGTG